MILFHWRIASFPEEGPGKPRACLRFDPEEEGELAQQWRITNERIYETEIDS